MTTPRIEIDLARLHHNAETLVRRLGARSVGVTGVTKVTLGSTEVARTLLHAGVVAIGESRIENVEALRRGGITAPITLIRSPLMSQVDRVVEHSDVSFNTEPDVIEALSVAAVRQDRIHGVVLMVELGDLREGILADDLEAIAATTSRLSHLELRGIGANLACQNGVVPDDRNMAQLSSLVASVERRIGAPLITVSGGNSASLEWAMSTGGIGRITDLRLGESIHLGREPLGRTAIDDLHLDVYTLVTEVIEAKVKPTAPWGDTGQAAFGRVRSTPSDFNGTTRVIAGVGRQDIDPDGLVAPVGMAILGASSDHLVLGSHDPSPRIGTELRLPIRGYGTLLRAMTSPFVTRQYLAAGQPSPQVVPA